MNKIFASAQKALFDVHDGVTLMAGGFGLCGNPENLILALYNKNIRDITLISNNCGTTDHGLGILLKRRQIKKIIASYVGENAEFERQFLNHELEVELVPQGTLAERIRAGGAGIPAFYTATGVGTEVARGKETREFDGRQYLLETALHANVTIVRAFKADPFGNLVFRKTARNFSPMMCTAAKLCIVEAEYVVKLGELDPELIDVPGIYVDRIIQGNHYEKWIEQRTTQGPRHAA